jgi:hypothetical protein
MPFDAAPRHPQWDDDPDRWLGRWLLANVSLRDMVQLYVGLGRRRHDGSVVLRDPRIGIQRWRWPPWRQP